MARLYFSEFEPDSFHQVLYDLWFLITRIVIPLVVAIMVFTWILLSVLCPRDSQRSDSGGLRDSKRPLPYSPSGSHDAQGHRHLRIDAAQGGHFFQFVVHRSTAYACGGTGDRDSGCFYLPEGPDFSPDFRRGAWPSPRFLCRALSGEFQRRAGFGASRIL